MKPIYLMFSAGLMAFFLSCSAPVDDQLISSYLPKSNKASGTVYYLGANKEIEDITNRFQAARMNDPDWFKDYLNGLNLEPGEIMPYHKKFQISEDEYNKFVDNVNDMKLIKLGEIELHFMQAGEEFNISIDGIKLPVTQVTINLNDNTAKTQFSILDETSEINQNSPDSPTGRWTGLQWKRVRGNPFTDGYSEEFAIGIMTDSKEGVLYYDLKSQKKKVETHFFVKYEL